MAKKKGGVITVALVCPECKDKNYYTSLNKATNPKLTARKDCKHCRNLSEYKKKKKLK